MGTSRVGIIIKWALRVFGYQIAFGLFGFLFTPAVVGSSVAIRVPVIGLLIAAAGYLMFMDGSYRGEKDCLMGETLDKLARKGSYEPSKAEEAKRFSRMKGIASAALGALPLVLIAVVVAVTAEPYAYALQDLPGWLNSYMNRAEVAEPLQYLRNVTVTATVVDYLRVGVRFVLFPYIGLMGTMSDAASLLFDQLSPLLVLIMPMICAIGYQFGPSRRAKNAKAIEEAKNKPRKRLKKAAAKRGGPEEKKQLV